jgi:hypothetical protein
MVRIIFILSITCASVAEGTEKKPTKKTTAGEGSFTATDSTKIDFTDTMIDGKMQAPAGFFLQGRQGQAMTQMVKLRGQFRSELRNSRAAVKSTVK